MMDLLRAKTICFVICYGQKISPLFGVGFLL